MGNTELLRRAVENVLQNVIQHSPENAFESPQDSGRT